MGCFSHPDGIRFMVYKSIPSTQYLDIDYHAYVHHASVNQFTDYNMCMNAQSINSFGKKLVSFIVRRTDGIDP